MISVYTGDWVPLPLFFAPLLGTCRERPSDWSRSLENQFATTPCLVIPHPLAFCTVNSGVSFCRWKESTLTLPYESSKTAWPVSQTESFFLPEFPLLTGDKEKKYKNLGEINKGAFGKVYRVEEEGRVYALKVLSKSKVSVFFLRVDETDYRRSESLTQT
jgi:hypothetical protein